MSKGRTLRNRNMGDVVLGGNELQFTSTYAISDLRVYSATLSPASVGASAVAVQTFTISGLETDDVLIVNAPFDDIGVGDAWVSAANKLKILFSNPTGAGITPSAASVDIVAFKATT